MGMLSGKIVLVTGVLTEESLAFGVARLAQAEGATVVISGAGRGLSLTRRVAQKLPETPEVVELDVTHPDQPAAAALWISERFGRLDGVLHSIGYAPPSCLGHGMFAATWEEVSLALQISAFSLRTLAEAMLPLLRSAGGGSIVGLDFDASVAWPGYDWMGVAKGAYEALSRYLARDLGVDKVRVNLVAAGPVRTIAAKSIPAFSSFEEAWSSRSPLGWDVAAAADAVARACVCLLSDWFPATTAEIVHVDGGYHAIGA